MDVVGIIENQMRQEMRRRKEEKLWKSGGLKCLGTHIHFRLECSDGVERTMSVRIDRSGNAREIQPLDDSLRLVDVLVGEEVRLGDIRCRVCMAVLEKVFVESVGRKRGFIADYDWYMRRGEDRVS